MNQENLMEHDNQPAGGPFARFKLSEGFGSGAARQTLIAARIQELEQQVGLDFAGRMYTQFFLRGDGSALPDEGITPADWDQAIDRLKVKLREENLALCGLQPKTSKSRTPAFDFQQVIETIRHQEGDELPDTAEILRSSLVQRIKEDPFFETVEINAGVLEISLRTHLLCLYLDRRIFTPGVRRRVQELERDLTAHSTGSETGRIEWLGEASGQPALELTEAVEITFKLFAMLDLIVELRPKTAAEIDLCCSLFKQTMNEWASRKEILQAASGAIRSEQSIQILERFLDRMETQCALTTVAIGSLQHERPNSPRSLARTKLRYAEAALHLLELECDHLVHENRHAEARAANDLSERILQDATGEFMTASARISLQEIGFDPQRALYHYIVALARESGPFLGANLPFVARNIQRQRDELSLLEDAVWKRDLAFPRITLPARP